MAASLLFLAFLLWPSPSHGLSSTPRVVAFVRQRSASALEAHAEHEHDVVGDDGAVDSASTSQPSPPNAFEKTVRSVTRSKNYRFGDLSKKVLRTSKTGVEAAVRTVKPDYQFGDFTIGALNATTKGVERTVQQLLDDEEYQFGDLTKGAIGRADRIMTYSEKSMSLMREANVHELVELMNLYWTKSMNQEERVEAFATAVYLGAILVLAFNFVSNMFEGVVFAGVWHRYASHYAQSPLLDWAGFLRMKQTADLVFGTPFLPARAIISIPFFFKYRKAVVRIAYKSPLRYRFPIINRSMSLLLSWVGLNLGLVAALTYGLVKASSLRTGVSIFT